MEEHPVPGGSAGEAESKRGSAMDFTIGSEVLADDGIAEARTSKTVDSRAHAVVTDDSRDALLTEFG